MSPQPRPRKKRPEKLNLRRSCLLGLAVWGAWAALLPTVWAQATPALASPRPVASPSTSTAPAAEGWVRGVLGQPRRVGEGRLRFLGMAIYDAVLWSGGPLNARAPLNQPLALELRYLRSLSGARIAQRSLDEMRRQPDFNAAMAEDWLAQLQALLPDVSEGDRIVGAYWPGEGLEFWVNGRLAGRVTDPVLARLFMGIWLAPQTSEAPLRERLLGLKEASP